MAKLLDLAGFSFGRLTGVRRVENLPGYAQARWLFRCECGNEKILFGYVVVHKKVKSCGCYMKEHPSHLRHGMTRTPEHTVWVAMRGRCEYQSNDAYASYGGRGIYVCDRWKSFENFYADMGRRPRGTSLDRKDNDGPYSLDNCRWATKEQQTRNRRTTTFYEHDGVRLCLQDWAEKIGLSYKTVWQRYKTGKRGAALFSTYVRGGGRRKQNGLISTPIN